MRRTKTILISVNEHRLDKQWAHKSGIWWKFVDTRKVEKSERIYRPKNSNSDVFPVTRLNVPGQRKHEKRKIEVNVDGVTEFSSYLIIKLITEYLFSRKKRRAEVRSRQLINWMAVSERCIFIICLATRVRTSHSRLVELFALVKSTSIICDRHRQLRQCRRCRVIFRVNTSNIR